MYNYIYIYYAEGTNEYKIGCTKHVVRRKGQLQTGNARKLNIIKIYRCINDVRIEHLVHEHFEANRLEGEWFLFTKKQLDECERVIHECIKNVDGINNNIDNPVNVDNIDDDIITDNINTNIVNNDGKNNVNNEKILQYKCAKCNSEFSTKGNLAKHLNKKIPCDEKKQMQEIKRKCTGCNKIFFSQQSLNYHIDGRCKILNDKHIENADFLKSELQKKDEELNDIKGLIIQLQKDFENFKQVKSNSSTDTVVNGTANIQHAETINNNTINNNTIQNIHNEIKILAYGKEDLSHITDDVYKKILNRGFQAVINYVEMVHFNKDKPENHNIQIKNWREGLVDIYNGEGWDKHHGDDMLEQIYNDKTTDLTDKYNDLEDELDDGTKKKFGNYMSKSDDAVTVKENKKKMKLMFYNKKDMVQKTHDDAKRKVKIIDKNIVSTIESKCI